MSSQTFDATVSANIGVTTMMPYRPLFIACFLAFSASFQIAHAQEPATETSDPLLRTNSIEITSPVPGQVVGVHTGMLQVQVKVDGPLEDDETSVTARAIGDNQIDYGPSPLSRIGATKYFGGPILVPASAEGKGFRIRAEAVFAVGEPGTDVEFDYIGIDLDADPPRDEAIIALRAPTAKVEETCHSDRIEITRPLKKEKVHVNADEKIFVQLKALDPVKPGSEVFAQAMTYDDEPRTWEKVALAWNEDLNLYEGWIEVPHSETAEGARFLIKGEVDFAEDGKPYRCTYHGPIFGLNE